MKLEEYRKCKKIYGQEVFLFHKWLSKPWGYGVKKSYALVEDEQGRMQEIDSVDLKFTDRESNNAE